MEDWLQVLRKDARYGCVAERADGRCRPVVGPSLAVPKRKHRKRSRIGVPYSFRRKCVGHGNKKPRIITTRLCPGQPFGPSRDRTRCVLAEIHGIDIQNMEQPWLWSRLRRLFQRQRRAHSLLILLAKPPDKELVIPSMSGNKRHFSRCPRLRTYTRYIIVPAGVPLRT